jgi:hypothetical protein
MELLLIIITFLVGIIVGVYIKRKQTYKGPRSSQVLKDYCDGNYRFEPEFFVCPPSINPDIFSHSEDSD